MKYSKQRELILKTLQENVVHPNAEYIYALAKKEDPKLSLATVYRNLNQLAENGIIKKIIGLDGSAHFDHNTFEHYHFICNCCNNIYDIPNEVESDISKKVEEITGFKITNFEISLKGICKNCQNKH